MRSGHGKPTRPFKGLYQGHPNELLKEPSDNSPKI